MAKTIHWRDYITINIFWLALTTLSQTMTPLLLPLLTQQFVGEELKATYYGTLRLWSLMTALLAQAFMGMLSDRSTSQFGRRRPFIIVGTAGVIAIALLIGFSARLEGFEGYAILFGAVILMMIFANTAHGALQGLIPDLVPEERRGIFSGIKAILEVPIPVILVSLSIARLISKGNIWGGLAILIGIWIVSAIITLFVQETAQQPSKQKKSWKPLVNLFAMTGIFTATIILIGSGIKEISAISKGMNKAAVIPIFAASGFGGMLAAVGFGVWASIKIGTGDELKNNPSFSWWVISRLAFLVGSTNIASFVIYFLQGRLGYYREQAAGPAAMLTMFVGIFILFTTVPAGWLSDKYGKKKILVASGIIGAAGAFLAIALPNLTTIYIGGIFIGAATGLFYAASWALGTEIIPPKKAGRYLGISNLAGAGAGAVGAYIGGPIADGITAQTTGLPGAGYMVLFGIYGAMFLVSIPFLGAIKEKRDATF
ncbi:MAG: MFS transporter [Anaerolineae bacterium]|nr:MFS transporter [Anaerolineae bacterium]